MKQVVLEHFRSNFNSGQNRAFTTHQAVLERVQLELRVGHRHMYWRSDDELSSGVVEWSKRNRCQSVKTILTGVAEVLYFAEIE